MCKQKLEIKKLVKINDIFVKKSLHNPKRNENHLKMDIFLIISISLIAIFRKSAKIKFGLKKNGNKPIFKPISIWHYRQCNFDN